MSFGNNILPIVLITVFILWYHSYTIGFIVLFNSTLLSWEIILYTILFHIFYYMMMWSLLATWIQPTAKVPHKYRLTTFQIRALIRSPDDKRHIVLAAFYQNKGIKMFCRTRNGNLRFCNTCYHFKPDRAHHCSQCDTCILKMDHHCQWLNTCIGLTNQKGFLLTLFYSAIFCTFYACTTFRTFVECWRSVQNFENYLGIIIGFVLAVILGPVCAIFCLFHFGLLAKNKTLLEDLELPYFSNKYYTYDLGFISNLNQVFGYNKFMWFLPIFNQEGPGLIFPTRKGQSIRRRRHEESQTRQERQALQRNLSDFIR